MKQFIYLALIFMIGCEGFAIDPNITLCNGTDCVDINITIGTDPNSIIITETEQNTDSIDIDTESDLLFDTNTSIIDTETIVEDTESDTNTTSDTETTNNEIDTETNIDLDTNADADTNSDSSIDSDLISNTDSDSSVDSDSDTELDTDSSISNFFTIIILPDTQSYLKYREEAFYAQTQWIVDNKDKLNIKFVSHSGDLVGTYTNNEQWNYASIGMDTLEDAGIPYSIAYGNHDADGRNTVELNTYFPLSRFIAMDGFGGSYADDLSDNIYHKVDTPELSYLIFSLEMGPRDEVLQWVSDIMTLNPTYNAMINTHSYINKLGELTNPDGDGHNATFYGLGEVNLGQEMWDDYLQFEDNLDFVFCGHVNISNGAALVTSLTLNGNTVHQLMANYQYASSTLPSLYGALRILKIYPENGLVDISTYSPYKNEYTIDSNSEFILYL